MSLPIFNTPSQDLSLLQTKWAAQLNPVLANPLLNGILIKNVILTTGNNTINTLLSRQQQGWIVLDQSAAAQLYRSQPFNAVTLTLNASAPCTISLWVF